MLAGASVVTDKHMKSLCFGEFMYPEAEKKIYDEIPDTTLLSQSMEHYLKEYNTISKGLKQVKEKIASECMFLLGNMSTGFNSC